MKEQTRSHAQKLDALIDAPRWLFLAVLIFAPFAAGSTTRWPIDLMEILIACILGLWLAAAALRRLPPFFHPVSLGCIAFLLLQGWGMTLNPHSAFDAETRTFTTLAKFSSWIPGTVDRAATASMMVRMTCLLGILCFVSDLAARSQWRRRIWVAISLAGVAMVLVGLIQRAGGTSMLFWGRELGVSPFFGTFYFHGNAGSYINLVLPFICGLAVVAVRNPEADMKRALWLSGLLLCVAGAFVNVSRAAAAITVLLLMVFVAVQAGPLVRNVWMPARSVVLGYAMAALVALTCLVLFTGLKTSIEKWAVLHSQLNAENTRLLSLNACLRMLPESGLWGMGAGTFEIAFPAAVRLHRDPIPQTWIYAHNDYIETLIEWGWIGSLAWAVLFFGGLRNGFVVWARGLGRLGEENRLLVFCTCLALAGVALHALVDFPLQIFSLQLYVATCLGLAWGITPDE